jgi:hypothetical protein
VEKATFFGGFQKYFLVPSDRDTSRRLFYRSEFGYGQTAIHIFYISCKKKLNLCLVAYFPTAFESCEKKSHSLIGPKEQVHRTIMKAIRKTGVKIHKTTSACTCSFKKLLIHSKTFGVTRLKSYNFNITTCVYGTVLKK